MSVYTMPEVVDQRERVLENPNWAKNIVGYQTEVKVSFEVIYLGSGHRGEGL